MLLGVSLFSVEVSPRSSEDRALFYLERLFETPALFLSLGALTVRN